MNGLIILISIVFVAFITYKITKIRMLKYILPPIISLLYGFILFFVGMGINGILYLVLAVVPVVVGVLYIVNQNYIKKK